MLKSTLFFGLTQRPCLGIFCYCFKCFLSKSLGALEFGEMVKGTMKDGSWGVSIRVFGGYQEELFEAGLLVCLCTSSKQVDGNMLQPLCWTWSTAERRLLKNKLLLTPLIPDVVIGILK